MCTRFYLSGEDEELAALKAQVLRSPLADSFIRAGCPILGAGEIRPTAVVPVLAPNRRGKVGAFPMRWGFRLPKGPLLVNARVETAASKPAFREAWRSRRCLIPASWYYEWSHLVDRQGRKVVGAKYMLQPQGEVRAWLAGLYRLEEGLPSFTVLTREAAEDIRYIHDRMPLILPQARLEEWLAPATLPETLLPYALTAMVAEKLEQEG